MIKKYTKYKQGIFTPKNREKYKGTWPIVYRSSYELRTFRYLDLNPHVVEWASESHPILYRDPTRNNEVHRYFIDIVFKLKDKNSNIHTYYCEIKPYSKTQKPKKTPKKREKTYLNECIEYARNMSKWNAAIEFAKKRGGKFVILTEREIVKF